MTSFSYVLAIVSISASLLPCSIWWSYTDSQIMLDNLSMNKRLTNRWKMMLETVLVCLLWFYWCLKMVYSVSRLAGYPHSICICQFEAKAVLMTMALLNWKWPHDGRIQRVVYRQSTKHHHMQGLFLWNCKDWWFFQAALENAVYKPSYISRSSLTMAQFHTCWICWFVCLGRLHWEATHWKVSTHHVHHNLH